MHQQRTAFVLGGSGFIGLKIVNALAKAGWRVRVGARNVNRARQARMLGDVGQIIALRTPIQDEQALALGLQGAELVVNCVGILNEFGSQTFDSVQAQGAINLARMAADAGVSDFIQISSMASDVNSASDYARTKAEAEAGILSYMPSAVILRPSLVFGPGDGFFSRFAGMARLSPFLPVIGKGETRFQPVYVGDVSAAVMASLAHAAAKGQVYELGGPAVQSYRELMEFMIGAIRRNRRLVSIPESVAAFGAMLTGWLPFAPLTNDQLALLEEDTVVSDGAKTLEDLGITPTPMEAIVPAYLSAFRPGGRFETEYVKT